MNSESNLSVKRLLIIGNGFDLAHQLPTRYQDMLEALKIQKEIMESSHSLHCPSYIWLKIDKIHQFSLNPFIQYFQDALDLNGWTDFETHIRNIIRCFQCTDVKKSPSPFSAYEPNPELYFTREVILWKQKKWGLLWNLLKTHLDELIEYIDCYLIRVLENHLGCSFDTDKYPHFIYEKTYDYLLSFNYTDTYYQIAKMKNLKVLPKPHFIHGTISSFDSFANIVLGIDDYDPENLETIYFKKYFQRIQKKTGREVFSWINPEENPNSEIIVDIFGHSLDITDKDILLKIMNRSVFTTIYYLNQSDYEQKILNLIRIFGSPDTFCERYYNNKIRLKCIDTE